MKFCIDVRKVYPDYHNIELREYIQIAGGIDFVTSVNGCGELVKSIIISLYNGTDYS